MCSVHDINVKHIYREDFCFKLDILFLQDNDERKIVEEGH